jgi:hypothetical protein
MCAPIALGAGASATPEDGARPNAKHVDARKLPPGTPTRGAAQVPAAAAGVARRGRPLLGSARAAPARTMGLARGNPQVPRGHVGIARSVPGTQSRGDLARPQGRALGRTAAANTAAANSAALKSGAAVVNGASVANGATVGRAPRVAGAAAPAARPTAVLGGPAATPARPTAVLGGPAATLARPTAVLGGPAVGRSPGGMQPRRKM